MVMPAPPPLRADEAETIRQLIEGEGGQPCAVLVRGVLCGKQAAWGSECPRCGAFGYWCQHHHEWYVRLLSRGATARCTPCRHLMPDPFPWVPL